MAKPLIVAVREAQLYLRDNSEGLNNFALIDKAGKIDYQTNQACYAMFLEDEEYSSNFKLWLDRVRWPNKLTKEIKEYIHFVVNLSAWRHVFLTKNPEEIFYLAPVLSAEYHAEYTIQAAMLLRYCDEFPYLVDRWHKLKTLINPDAALAMCQHIETTKTGIYIVSPSNPGHVISDDFQTGPNRLWAIMNHLVPKRNQCFGENTYYNNLMTGWDKNEDEIDDPFPFPEELVNKRKNTLGLDYYVTGFDETEFKQWWDDTMHNLYGGEYVAKGLHSRPWR